MLQILGFITPALVMVSDCDECGFNDLGKLLFGGLLLALIIGVAVSLLHRRMKEKSEEAGKFVSIRPNGNEE